MLLLINYFIYLNFKIYSLIHIPIKKLSFQSSCDHIFHNGFLKTGKENNNRDNCDDNTREHQRIITSEISGRGLFHLINQSIDSIGKRGVVGIIDSGSCIVVPKSDSGDNRYRYECRTHQWQHYLKESSEWSGSVDCCCFGIAPRKILKAAV